MLICALGLLRMRRGLLLISLLWNGGRQDAKAEHRRESHCSMIFRVAPWLTYIMGLSGMIQLSGLLWIHNGMHQFVGMPVNASNVASIQIHPYYHSKATIKLAHSQRNVVRSCTKTQSRCKCPEVKHISIPKREKKALRSLESCSYRQIWIFDIG